MSRLLPEWSRVQDVLIAWPYPGSDWDANLPAAQTCYWDMLFHFMQASDVIVLLHPNIDKTVWHLHYQNRLKNAEASPFTCRIIESIAYDDTWVRDYAPLSTPNFYLSFSFNGWGNKYPSGLDDRVAEKMAPLLTKPVKKIPLIGEGGAIEINDDGIVLANKACVMHTNRNTQEQGLELEKAFLSHLHAQKIEWLDVPPLSGDDTDGHVDTLARFADNNTVIYCAPCDGHPDNDTLLLLKQQLEAISASYGWTLIGLPSPLIYSALDNALLLPGTYANFLICNDSVFVPIYGVEQDKQAVDIFTHVFKYKQVVPLRCEALLEQHGSLHCATMQIC